MFDSCEEYMTGKYMSDIIVAKTRSFEQQSEYEKKLFLNKYSCCEP